MQFFVDERDMALREVLAGAGYAVIRSSYEMERWLEGELEPPVWPDGLDPARVRGGGRRGRVCRQEEAFADHWGFEPGTFESWRAYNLAEDRGSVPLADRLGRRRGRGSLHQPAARAARTTTVDGSAARACDGPGAAAGSARRCSATRSSRFAERGKRSAGLGVDAENTTGAVALYERVGMHVVRRSDTWERTV